MASETILGPFENKLDINILTLESSETLAAAGISVGTTSGVKWGHLVQLRLDVTLNSSYAGDQIKIATAPIARYSAFLHVPMNNAAGKKPLRVNANTDGGIYIRFGEPGLYIFTLLYICV